MKASTYLNEIIKPLSVETEALFSPADFQHSDHLYIRMDDEGEHFIVQAKSIRWDWDWGSNKDQRRVGCGSHASSNTWFQRIPERKRLAMPGQWKIAATDINALLIKSLWADDRIHFDDEESSLLFIYLVSRFTSQNIHAMNRAKFKAATDKEAFVNDFIFNDREDKPLTPYQRMALSGCMYQEASGLFMEQGTGKSAVVVARVNNEAVNFDQDRMYRCLVVCPKNVRMNWLNQFEQFSTCDGKVAVVRGNALNRAKNVIEALAPYKGSKWTAVIVSYETVTLSYELLAAIEWDLMVADESHYFKSPYTTRFKTMMNSRNIARQRMCLTGTPITNYVLDLFPQFEFMGKGLSGFVNWKTFRSYYGKFVKRDNVTVFTGYQNLPFLQERLHRLSFLITKKEALPELPDKLYDVIEVEMTPDQRKIYKQVQRDLAIEIEADMNRTDIPKTLVVQNILTKMLRLAQITSGFVTWDAVYDDEGNELRPKIIDRIDPNPKLEELVTLIQESAKDEKFIVWGCWVQDIKSIAARLEVEGFDCVTYYGQTKDDDRVEAERRFNCDPNCKVFIGNPQAGGTGLNLHGYDIENPETSLTNASHVVYFSQNWSMVYRSQSEDRCHRKGTRVPVQVTDLCVPGSIDEEIRTRVTNKRLSAYEIQECKDIVARLLSFVPSQEI